MRANWCSASRRGVIDLLAGYGIDAYGGGMRRVSTCARTQADLRPDRVAPDSRCAMAAPYHGVACNVAMDLSPFACINPCGHQRTGSHRPRRAAAFAARLRRSVAGFLAVALSQALAGGSAR